MTEDGAAVERRTDEQAVARSEGDGSRDASIATMVNNRGCSPAIRPAFLGALKGMWLLTWRRKISLRQLPLHLASLLAIPTLAYFVLDAANPNTYYWFIGLYLQVILPFFCLSVFGDLIREEIQGNTLVFFTTRPVTRAQLLLTKFVCLLAWVEVLALGNSLCLVLVGMIYHLEQMASLAGYLLSTQSLAVLAFGSLSALLGLIQKRFLVLGVIYGFVVEVGIGQIPTNINTLSMTRHVKTLMGNHSVLGPYFNWSPEGTGTSVLALLIASGLFLAAASLLFSFREFLHGEEMQK
jgi:ABC-type transport system involved in multi-copper enzyme maturation permease subunit